MKRWMWISAAPAIVLVTMLATSRGQPASTPPPADGQAAPASRPAGDFRVRLNEGRGPRGPGDDRGPGDGPPPEDRFGGPGGPGGREGGPGGIGMRRPPSVDTMRNYLELVDRYAAMSSDPIKAGVGAVITAADLLRAQGNDAAIKYFEEILADEKSPLKLEINRAIRLQLAELYKAAGNSDKALEELKVVMQSR